MKYLYIFILSCLTLNLYSQDSCKNYIHSYVMLDQAASKCIETIQYFDGLGRSFMTVQKGVTPSRKNLLTEQWRDETGRLVEDRLPIVTTSDRVYSYKEAMATYNDGVYYTEYAYDYSPLKRVISIMGPGENFSRDLSTGYSSNKATGILLCKLYKVTFTGELVLNGNYAEKELSVVREKDEDHNETYTFRDKQDRKVLVRQMLGDIPHDTYFVYDACDNLIFVLPPAYQDEPDLDLYAYQYKYDNWGHCIEKKIPGCQPIKYVYDQADNLIFSQDGVQREKLEWTFYLYDNFHRLTVKGICGNTNTSSVSERIVVCSLNKDDSGSIPDGLENTGYSSDFELVSPIIHQVNYYDDYSFLSLVGFQNRAKFPAQTVAANGFLTGSISSVLDTSAKLYTAAYYDIKGRPIRVTQDDHLGGYKITVTNYTFTGKPSQVVNAHYHTKETAKLEIYKYTYDHADRLVKTTHQLGPNAPIVVLSENTYDELGRLSTKTYHQNDSLKSTYTYNIRNWLTGITGSKFTQKLFYNEQDEDNTPCYNGNISQMNWSVTSEAGLIRNYNFQYDELNRLKRAIYGESNDDPNYCPDYGVDYVYDKMGNLTLVRRYGLLNKPDDFDMIDDLFIDYNGNQLKAIDDNSAGDPLYEGAFNFVDGSSKPQEYFYDANGSLVKDLNKGITSIRYNSLNLPSQVILHMSGYIDYQYSADGVKRRKESYTKLEQVVDPIPGFQISNNLASSLAMQRDVSNLVLDSRARYKGYTCTDYCGNFIYEDGELSRILTEDGYITLNGNVSTYHYYLRDHQGNNRVVADQYGTVEEVNHYYPYGGLFGEGVEKSKQPYKYGGKELDRMHGLDWYDFGARPYDGVVGGFLTIDPLCEKYYSISPYAYCANNPIRFIDPDGREPRIYVETQGFGHVFVTTGTGNNTTVYTYGRYGELGKNKSSARSTTPTGEGVLIKLTGDEAKSFIQDQITNKGAVAFEFTKGSDEAVSKHFDGKFDSSNKTPAKGDYVGKENAKVIDTYNVLTNNCVTTSVEGVQSGSKQDLKLGNLKGPMAVRDVLNVQSEQRESNVIKIPTEEIKKELKLPNE